MREEENGVTQVYLAAGGRGTRSPFVVPQVEVERGRHL